jgi:Homeodomain-like domain
MASGLLANICSALRKEREQAEAKRLRRQGKSLREIARALDVSLSSVSVWVRDIPRMNDPGSPDKRPTSPVAPTMEGIRRCGRCRNVLPLSAFNRNGSGNQWWCRECFRAYFRERGDLHRRQSGAALRKRRAAARRFVREHLMAHPCVDCGEQDPVVLEFDHMREKLKGISILVASGAPLEALREEIAKCEVMCVNCHRWRTARRGNWCRAAEEWWNTAPPGDHFQSRNIAFAYSYLERNPCIDCGCSDICVLEFDHIGEKNGNVLALARSGVSLDRLRREISRCAVRCGNCYRRRTAERRRSAA